MPPRQGQEAWQQQLQLQLQLARLCRSSSSSSVVWLQLTLWLWLLLIRLFPMQQPVKQLQWPQVRPAAHDWPVTATRRLCRGALLWAGQSKVEQ